jgi:Domain of unknown function (DUF4276)
VTIGVGVEGPSDLAFWKHVLGKHFKTCRFDVRNMKNRDKLIRAAPNLYEEFKNAGRSAAIILVDRDSDTCVEAVRNRFEPSMRQEASLPINQRYLFLLVAIKQIECWYLADAGAINSVIPNGDYSCPPDTCRWNGKRQIKDLLRAAGGAGGFNEIAFARSIAPKFTPARAKQHSKSFAYSWKCITEICES